MAAPTNWYCDPTLTSNTGDGTSYADRWGRASDNVVQYAIDNATADATDGVRINVKSGTPNASGDLAATLDLGSHTTSEAAPLIIQGYDTVAEDGGIGEIDGGASYGCFAAAEDYIDVIDMADGAPPRCGEEVILDVG